MNGILLINHSPRLRIDAPNHDGMNTPTENINVMDVVNPIPNKEEQTRGLSNLDMYECSHNMQAGGWLSHDSSFSNTMNDLYVRGQIFHQHML